jgi:hypothetical protein
MEKQKLTLPENAGRELKPGEKYMPLLTPEKKFPEVTPYSVAIGLLMVIIFSAAAAYLGLKIGQVFEAAIPIAIIAVGLTSALGKKGGLGQNVIIQSIGGCSGAVVAGAIFTLPALYILQGKTDAAGNLLYPGLNVNFWQMFLSSLLGGCLGILFLIPFRKYFVKEMHGKYPFPEATATTQVLVSGESGGNEAKTLLLSGLIGGLYDFIVSTFGLWAETNQKPEFTQDYEGFFHIIHFEGTVENAKFSYIIRDHDRKLFEQKKQVMMDCVKFINDRYGEGTACVEIKDQYYNMRGQVEPHFFIVERAVKAMEMAGIKAKIQPIRGGTDGANLSFKGLPCPNIFAGGLNFHGKMEFVPEKSLRLASEVVVNLVSLFAE